MKKISASIVLIVIVVSLFSCKSGKASCDAYSQVETSHASTQTSK